MSPRFARRLLPRRVGSAVVVALALALPGTAIAGTVSGVVYEDFNGNGTRDTGAPATATDSGVGGVAVTAYDGTGKAVATTTSAADGSYRLTGVTGRLRIEFTGVPAGYESAPHGKNSKTSVQFVDATGDVTADYGVLQPSHFCQDNADLALACYRFGAHTGTNANAPALYFFPENIGGNSGPSVQQSTIATLSQVGSIYGLATRPGAAGTRDLFASAYMKRHTGFGPNGPGAIYRFTKTATGWTTTLFATLPGTATNPHAGNGENYVTDNFAAAWDAVGKTSIGDIDATADGSTLYAISQETRRLHTIPLGGTTGTPDAGVEIPNPGCANAADWRPFAIGLDGAKVYVGGVCSAESSQNPAELKAVVLRYSAGSFTSVLEFPLTYQRKCANGATNTSIDDPNNVRDCKANRAGAWLPWRKGEGTIVGEYDSLPQPMLSDIAFDSGNMVLGLRDRYGDQMGNGSRGPTQSQTALIRALATGDILRACAAGNGGWTLESNATCGGVSTSGKSPAPQSCASAIATPGCEGPGGGEFYVGDDSVPHHDDTTTGGLAVIGGHGNVMTSMIEPETNADGSSRLNDGGVGWLSNSTGKRQKGYRAYIGSANPNFQVFAKSNGVGDLEAFCDRAPLEIGNRVWIDPDGNGVQDADEDPIPGVVVQLVDANGSVIGSTTTDADGAYYFTVNPGTTYTVRIDLAQPVLQPYVPTPANQGGNGSTDSNGIETGPNDDAIITTGGPGQNDHTVDFGFTPLKARVTIEKRASKKVVIAGGKMNFTLIVRSVGKVAAENVKVCDKLPPNMTYVTLGGGKAKNGRVCWRLGTMPVGASRKITFTVKVDVDAKKGKVTNVAVVTAANAPPATARRTVTIKRPPVKPRRRPPGVTG